jgi:hypothetical protein
VSLPRPALAEVLARLGPQVRRGALAPEPVARMASGIPVLDRLLGGGFPCGRLSEIAGPLSSGRTSLAFALLATSLRAGGMVAWVDAADAFDPASATAAGVPLARVLWVRGQDPGAALRGTERLLETRGLPLVLLDLALPGPSPRVAPAVWPRLARAAEASATTLVVLSTGRLTGTSAALALALEPAQAHFSGTPGLFEGLEARAGLVRSREAGGGSGLARVRLHEPRRVAS